VVSNNQFQRFKAGIRFPLFVIGPYFIEEKILYVSLGVVLIETTKIVCWGAVVVGGQECL
jgi:hypothetical protein